MVTQSWIRQCLKIYKIPDEDIKFTEKTMETWSEELTAGWKKLSWSKDPETSGAINITICDRIDATQ